VKSVLLSTIALAAFVATPAMAADMPVKAPIYKAPPAVWIPNWTGFYLGVHGGCGWSRSPTPSNYEVDPGEDNGVFDSKTGSGCFGGGQIGYNYQFSNKVVLGFEADASLGRIATSFLWNQGAGDDINIWESKLTSFGTIRGRVGYAEGQFLPYMTGGFAWGRNEITSFCSVIDPASCDPAGGAMVSSEKKTHFGWVIGAGLEYALTPSWSIKGEYLHLDLASKRYNVQVDFDTGVAPGLDSGRLKVDTVKVGLNFHPNWGR
jgi:outer membrane immunogenic protein